ncbi:hypothetical protein [Streptomyces cinerochromogenes]
MTAGAVLVSGVMAAGRPTVAQRPAGPEERAEAILADTQRARVA